MSFPDVSVKFHWKLLSFYCLTQRDALTDPEHYEQHLSNLASFVRAQRITKTSMYPVKTVLLRRLLAVATSYTQQEALKNLVKTLRVGADMHDFWIAAEDILTEGDELARWLFEDDLFDSVGTPLSRLVASCYARERFFTEAQALDILRDTRYFAAQNEQVPGVAYGDFSRGKETIAQDVTDFDMLNVSRVASVVLETEDTVYVRKAHVWGPPQFVDTDDEVEERARRLMFRFGDLGARVVASMFDAVLGDKTFLEKRLQPYVSNATRRGAVWRVALRLRNLEEITKLLDNETSWLRTWIDTYYGLERYVSWAFIVVVTQADRNSRPVVHINQVTNTEKEATSSVVPLFCHLPGTGDLVLAPTDRAVQFVGGTPYEFVQYDTSVDPSRYAQPPPEVDAVTLGDVWQRGVGVFARMKEFWQHVVYVCDKSPTKLAVFLCEHMVPLSGPTLALFGIKVLRFARHQAKRPRIADTQVAQSIVDYLGDPRITTMFASRDGVLLKPKGLLNSAWSFLVDMLLGGFAYLRLSDHFAEPFWPVLVVAASRNSVAWERVRPLHETGMVDVALAWDRNVLSPAAGYAFAHQGSWDAESLFNLVRIESLRLSYVPRASVGKVLEEHFRNTVNSWNTVVLSRLWESIPNLSAQRGAE